MKRIAIVGCRTPEALSREWVIWAIISRDVEAFVLTLPRPCVIVSGGAVGVDRLAARIARRIGLEVVEHLPNYGIYKTRATRVRNQKIVDDSDIVHAWPGPSSRGTWMTVGFAKEAGKFPEGCLHEPWKLAKSKSSTAATGQT